MRDGLDAKTRAQLRRREWETWLVIAVMVPWFVVALELARAAGIGGTA